jgi:hypothetical protein
MSETREKSGKSFAQVKAENQQACNRNELYCMYAIARFGWLTHYQIAQLLFGNDHKSYEKSRKLLSRLVKTNCVRKVVLGGNKKVKASGVLKAYLLKPRGMQRLKVSEHLYAEIRRRETKRSIMNQRYHYHRTLANQILIDVLKSPEKFSFSLQGQSRYFSETEVNLKQSTIFNTLGCVPDALLYDDNQMFVFEIENSRRGKLHHGLKYGIGNLDNKEATSKAIAFLPAYIEKLVREGSFQVTDGFVGRANVFTNVREVLVCSDESIFRSIWRLVEVLVRLHCSKYGSDRDIIEGHITYIVLNERRWVDPLQSSNIQIFDHLDELIPMMLADADPVGRSTRLD